MRAFGEALVTWRPPVDTKGDGGDQGQVRQRQSGDRAELHHPTPEMGHP